MRFSHALAAGFLGLLLASFGASPATARIFRWVDEKGEIHFTSDLNQVPPQFRGQAVAPQTDTKSTLNVTPQEGDPAQDAARDQHLQDLRKLNAPEAAPPVTKPKSGSVVEAKPEAKSTTRMDDIAEKKPEKAAEPPRKYEPDCDHKGDDGRCRSELNPEWVKWNKDQKAKAPADAEQ